MNLARFERYKLPAAFAVTFAMGVCASYVYWALVVPWCR